MSNESNTLATTQPDALSLLATRFAMDPERLYNTLKNTVFKKATDDEFEALLIVANTYGLNPVLKELYAFPAKSGGIVPVVSVDGWISLCNSHPQFDGIEFEFKDDDKGNVVSCTAIIYRKDRSHPTKATEFVSECRRDTEPWKMVRRMIRHKAMIQCARIAFGFSGIHDEDEAAAVPGLANARDVTPQTARAVPINPFKQKPTTEEQPAVVDAEHSQSAPIEPATQEIPAMEDNPALLDLLDSIELSNTCEELNTCKVKCAEIEHEAHRNLAKQSVVKKAKELELIWDKRLSAYTIAA